MRNESTPLINNTTDTRRTNELLGRILEDLLNRSIEILHIERENNKENVPPEHPNIIANARR
jgi:hypothetical protein